MSDQIARYDASTYGLERYTPSIFAVLNAPWPRTIGERVRVTEEVYHYFLNILPPIYCDGGFLVSEPDSETPEGTVYSKFFQTEQGFFHEWVVVPMRHV